MIDKVTGRQTQRVTRWREVNSGLDVADYNQIERRCR